MFDIKKYLFKNLLTISGVIVGIIGGFLYWRFVGCNSGTCPITSTWYGSSAYGALMGSLVFSLFKKSNNDSQKKDNKE